MIANRANRVAGEVAANAKTSFTSPASTTSIDSDFGSSALYARGGSNSRPRRDNNRNARGARYCDHSQKSGHTQDQCFKIIGYPDWYDGPRDTNKGKRGTKLAAAVVTQLEQLADSPLDEPGGSTKMIASFDPSMVRVVRFGFGLGLCSVQVNFRLSPFGSGTGSDRVKFGFGSISGQSCSVQV